MTTKQQKLDTVIAELQKKLGNKAIQRGIVTNRAAISTGFASLDKLIGGGIPRGALTEIVGNPTSGMTTIALNVMAAAQKQGEGVVYIDVASAFDPAYAAHRGVNIADLMIVRDAFEKAVAFLHAAVASKIPDVVVFNSVPKRSGRENALLAKFIDRCAPTLSSTRCAVMVLSLPSTGRPLLNPYATLRLRTTFERWIGTHRVIQGYQAVATILRDKQGKEGTKAPFQVMLDEKTKEGET